MTYTPIIPTGGSAGWAYLQRTRQTQQAAFDASKSIQRDTDYFEANIAKVRSAEELVKDFRLLKVALGAFGLDQDIGSRFFVRKVFEEGTLAPDSFANKLSDKRYRAMSKAFGFDLSPPSSTLSDFGARITAAYRERQFEAAVGQQDQDLRLVMGFDRELRTVAKASSDDAMWFTIMATQPLRKVFEGALNLPASVGALDIDRQLAIFKQKSSAYFGTSSPRDFLESGKQEELTRRFLINADLRGATSSASAGSIALTLLQAMPRRPSLLG